MTNNIFIGYFIGGIGFTLILLCVFQVGLNMGIRMSLELLDGEYPAAFKFLQRNKSIGRVLPYVIAGGNNDQMHGL